MTSNREIKPHLGHLDCLEVVITGDRKQLHSVAVECTKCGEIIEELYDRDDEYVPRAFRYIVATTSPGDTGLALVQLSEDVVEDLLLAREHLLRTTQIGGAFIDCLCVSLNPDEASADRKDYDAIGKNDADWAWLHEDVISANPPDHLKVHIEDDATWNRLIDLPRIEETCVFEVWPEYFGVAFSSGHTVNFEWYGLQRFLKEAEDAAHP